MNNSIGLSDQVIAEKIHLIRGKKVMLDKDLAALYGVTTGNLNKAVKRNIRRFPEDFMFQLDHKDLGNLIFQNGISSWGGNRKFPFAFTELGLAMLSSVLSSETAVDVNIQIIRVFTRMRETLINHKDILLKLDQLERKIFKQDEHLNKHEGEIQLIFKTLKELLNQEELPRKRVGYRKAGEKD
jgi:hypothetical protein